MNAFGSAMAIAPGVDDGQTVTRARNRTRSLGFRLPLQRLPVLTRNDGDEFAQRIFALRQHSLGARTTSQSRVGFNQVAHQISLSEIEQWDEIDHPGVALLRQLIELVEDEHETTAHPRREISTGAPEHDDVATSHVLTTVIPDPFDHRVGTAISHREALASHAGEVGFARRRTVQHGVADQNGLIGNELHRAWMTDDQPPAGESFPDVVGRTCSRSLRPIISSSLRKPSRAMISRTSSATKKK